MSRFTKREIALFVGGMIVAAVLVVEGTYYAIEKLVPSDPRDPPTKTGDLKPDQSITKMK